MDNSSFFPKKSLKWSPLIPQFEHVIRNQSDINEHLTTLYHYAAASQKVIECGVRNPTSTWAFLQGLIHSKKDGKKLIGIDLNPISETVQKDISEVASKNNIQFEFIQGNDLKVNFGEIGETGETGEKYDLIFIDTWHVYGQLKRELDHFSPYSTKYIILHDTTVDADSGETIRNGWNAEEQSLQTGIPVNEIKKGLWPAVLEFVESHPDWKIKTRFTHNNGLTVLEKIGSGKIDLDGVKSNSPSKNILENDQIQLCPRFDTADHTEYDLGVDIKSKPVGSDQPIKTSSEFEGKFVEFQDYPTLKPKVILVTGVAGFIASNFINHMVPSHPNITFIGVDKLSYCSDLRNFESIAHLKNFHFHQIDLKEKDAVSNLFSQYKIDTIVHFAAYTHVDRSFGNSIEFTENNILATHILLEFARVRKIERFIFVSTDEVYGSSEVISTENSSLDPTNPYAATKCSAEFLVKSYYHSFQLPIIITRGNNAYGPHQFPDKIIPLFILNLESQKKCQIHGTGQQKRSFLHVFDIAKAFEKILFKGKIGEIYNLGSEHEISVIQLAKKIISILKPGENSSKWLEYVKDRPFNDVRYFISSQKLRNLGWREKIDFDEGLKKTIEWYQSKINRWKISSSGTNVLGELEKVKNYRWEGQNEKAYQLCKKLEEHFDRMNMGQRFTFFNEKMIVSYWIQKYDECFEASQGMVNIIKLMENTTISTIPTDLSHLIQNNNFLFNHWLGKNQLVVRIVENMSKGSVMASSQKDLSKKDKSSKKYIIFGPYEYQADSFFCPDSNVIFRPYSDINRFRVTNMKIIDERRNLDLVIGLLACCSKEKYMKQIEACYQTWIPEAKQLGMAVFLLNGEKCGGECQKDDPYNLHLKDIGDDYSSAYQKQWDGMMKMFQIYPQAKYYYVAGTDTYIRPNKILELLNSLNHNDDLYIGGHGGNRRFIDEGKVKNVYFHSGGSGFLLTNSVMTKINPQLKNWADRWTKLCQIPENSYLKNACDVAIAYYLQKSNLAKVIKIDKFRGCNWKGIANGVSCCSHKKVSPKDIWVCHFMNPPDMKEYYDYLHS